MQLLYDSKNNPTSNLEHLQHFDANDINVHYCKLLTIVHDCYILTKPSIRILGLLQLFKIPVRAVQVLYDSKNKPESNLEHVQHFDANGIVVHPC